MLKLVGVETCLETCHCFSSLFSVFACKEVISKAAQEFQEEEEIMNVREMFQERIFLGYKSTVSAFLKSLQQWISCHKCKSVEFFFSYYIWSTSSQWQAFYNYIFMSLQTELEKQSNIMFGFCSGNSE